MNQTLLPFFKASRPLYFEDAAEKTRSILAKYSPEQCAVSYSGGSDSDSLLWFLREIGFSPKAVFFNTGIEYLATKRHIDWMRSQGFDIETAQPRKCVPRAVRDYGTPWWSKFVSDQIHRLQINGFKFEDKSFDELIKEYPTSRSALRWWCNGWRAKRRNISWNPLMREFLIAHPPGFRIHSACCDWAKKDVSKTYCRKHGIKLVLTGIRKAEGGIRASALKQCFLAADGGHREYDIFMPMFWWSNEEKQSFDIEHQVLHSDCYTVYGLKRTGCAGCPFGHDCEKENQALRQFEPNMAKATNNLFGVSYEYTRQFEEFRRTAKLTEVR